MLIRGGLIRLDRYRARMRTFLDALRERNPQDPDARDRRWLYVPYDQLTDKLGPLAREDPGTLGIVLVESADKAARRPYHQQKLLWVLASMRHFALEQAERGVMVDYRAGDATYADVLADVVEERGALAMMEAAERELRAELAPLVEDGRIEVLPHEGWLTTDEDFDTLGAPPWRMDAFYRHVRRRTGILMEDGKPVGGRYSHDGDNRQPWSGDPPAPSPPTFDADPITAEAAELVASRFSDHPGALAPDRVAATQAQAEAAWQWARTEAMPCFGPYEDAMSREHRQLFHTMVSPLLHNHRILPQRVVQDVLALDVPLSSREGFVRQVIGWREFVRHVHRRTDGFRDLPEGYSRGVLGEGSPLPPVFWGQARSGLQCLDDVVDAVWEDGYSHHITRLMVLSNLATLLDLSAQELSDWFWVAYIDAYDWVVEPNVLGMGTFSVGDLMTTKPYVSGAAYIHKMSDHCGSCAFHPKKTCPITSLYWAFLARHEAALSEVERTKLQLASMRKRADAKKQADDEVFRWVQATLAAGEALTPDR